MRVKRIAGFTLLEVMVALFILAVAAAAMVQATSTSIRNADYLAQRQLAMWVANNALERAMLPNAKRQQNGETKFGGHSFKWKVEAKNTSLDKFTQLTATVYKEADPSYALATLIGYKDGL